jgi:transglutaminase-like putative cysteine protease
MHDAAVERLSKLISNPNNDDSGNKEYQRKSFQVQVKLAEGWFSLFLLSAVVYSTIWCVQAVGWVDHLNGISLTTAVGLIVGVIAAKQQRFSRWLIHPLVILFGLLFAYWQTAGVFYQGSVAQLAHVIQTWYATVTHGGVGDEDAIFFLFISTLSFLLAYLSAWLVYRTRNPWLMIVANAVVLLVNLSATDNGYVFFLVVFLIASLLLVLRFNLYESVRRWQRQGLRYADDIGWDVMQAGALISIAILIISWILPWGYTNVAASQVWNVNSSPWVQLENTWDRIISVQGGVNPANRGNFRDMLVLAGNPNLNHDIVFTVQSGDGSQYLASISYDTYTKQGWSASSTDALPIKANQNYQNSAVLTRPVQQKITVVNAPGEQNPYLFGASQLASSNLPASVLQSHRTGEAIAWIGQNGFLTNGAKYNVISAISAADVKTLEGVPMPADAPKYLPPTSDAPVPVTYYNPEIVSMYTQLPGDLDPHVIELAKKITASHKTMYEKVQALETYLRTNYTYSVDIRRPSNEDGVSWFLFRSGNKGFCNYFASAMAVMARSQGIPARVVAGYTNGEYDAHHRQQVIRGTDAHSWVQVYFAGYGWVNFEPSATFATFARPQPNQYAGSSVLGGAAASAAGALGVAGKNTTIHPDASDNSSSSADMAAQNANQLRQQIGFTLSSLILVILFSCIIFGLWWRRLFRRYSLPTQLYGRIVLLASWAGVRFQPAQTPYEYIHELQTLAPNDTETLEHLGDIYVRERWADPQSEEHPRHKGELQELPVLWRKLQPRLFLYVLRHPHFLRWLPRRAGMLFSKLRARRRAKKNALAEDEI